LRLAPTTDTQHWYLRNLPQPNMPPKAARAPRAARGGRAGATSGRASNSEMAPTTTPQSSEPVAASEAPAQPVVKQDDEEDSKPPTPAENTPAPTDQTPGPADGTDTPGRAPVQRLGSLNASRSASPAIRRGSTTRGKRGMVKPTFTGRRSKEERTTLEKEALEREKARNREREAADARKQRDADRRAKRDADRAVRGRGGYSGAMSGPFSLGSSREGNLRFLNTMNSSDNYGRSKNQPPFCWRLRRWIGLKSGAHKIRGRRRRR
jgi:DNA-directed RNA polymerase III subunit RPC4